MIKLSKTQSTGHTREECIKKFKDWWRDPSDLHRVLENCLSGDDVFSLIDGISPSDSERINNPNKLVGILFDVVGSNFIYSIHGDEKQTRTRKFRAEIIKAAIKKNQFSKGKIIRIAQESHSKLSNCSTIEQISHYRYKPWLEELTKWLDLPLTTCQKPKGASKHDKTETIEANIEYKPLYDYQYTAGLKIKNMLEGIDEQKKLLLSIPTGSGKTRLVVEALIDWLNDGREDSPSQQKNSKYMIWIAQSHELCEQAIDAFKTLYKIKGNTALNIHRFFGAGGTPPNFDLENLLDANGLIVATIHSFDKLIPKNKEVDAQDEADDSKEEEIEFTDENPLVKLAKITSCIVIDEAHRSTSKMYTRFLRAMGFNFYHKAKNPNANNIVLIGLTATPFRGRGVDFENNPSQLNSQTIRLRNRFGGEPYYPEIYESVGEKKHKPIAIIDCPHIAYNNENVRISGDRSFDNESVIQEYSWRITYLPPISEVYNNPKPLPNPKPEKIVSYKFKIPGEYKISLTVINNENLPNKTEKFIKILHAKKINEISGVDKQKLLYNRLIQRKILCEVYRANIKGVTTTLSPEDSAEYIKKREYQKQTLRELGENFERNKIILDVILQLRKYGRKKILVFACNIEHARKLAIILKSKSLNVEYIDSQVDTGRRIEIIKKFKEPNDDINVLCNVDILTTGFDAPNIDCVFVTRPAKSTVLYTQMIGRGMRGTRGGGTPDMWLINMDDNIQLYYQFDEKAEFGWKIFEDSWKSLPDLGVQLPFMVVPKEKISVKQKIIAKVAKSEKKREKKIKKKLAKELKKQQLEQTEIISLSCIDCKFNADGIEEIQTIFGIYGDPKLLTEHIKSGNFSDIPKKCRKCRDQKTIDTIPQTISDCPYLSFIENQQNIKGNYQMVLGLYLADQQQLKGNANIEDARKFLLRHNPSKTLSDIPQTHAVFDVYKRNDLIQEITSNGKIIFKEIIEPEKFRESCIKKIETYEESIKQKTSEQVSIPKEELELAKKLDEHYIDLKTTVIGHIPTTRQFQIFTDDAILKIMIQIYSNYSNFLESKNENISEDQALKDKLYDEYFELYHSVNRSITKNELDEYGKYTLSDYEESFGSYIEFSKCVDEILSTMRHIKNPKNEQEFLDFERKIKKDYQEIKENLNHVPHFEEFKNESKLGIGYCLLRYGSFGRFKKISDKPENDQNTITHLQEEYQNIKKLLKMSPTFTQMLKHCRTGFKIMDLFGNYSKFIEFLGDSKNTKNEPNSEFKNQRKQELINKTLKEIKERGRENAMYILLKEEPIPYNEWFGSKDSFVKSLDKEDPWIVDKYNKIKQRKKPTRTGYATESYFAKLANSQKPLKTFPKIKIKKKCPWCKHGLVDVEGQIYCPNRTCNYYR